jgi:hypothetical protein
LEPLSSKSTVSGAAPISGVEAVATAIGGVLPPLSTVIARA